MENTLNMDYPVWLNTNIALYQNVYFMQIAWFSEHMWQVNGFV